MKAMKPEPNFKPVLLLLDLKDTVQFNLDIILVQFNFSISHLKA